MGGGDQSGFENPIACLDRFFDVQRTYKPVLCGSHRQVDDGNLPHYGLGVVITGFAAVA